MCKREKGKCEVLVAGEEGGEEWVSQWRLSLYGLVVLPSPICSVTQRGALSPFSFLFNKTSFRFSLAIHMDSIVVVFNFVSPCPIGVVLCCVFALLLSCVGALLVSCLVFLSSCLPCLPVKLCGWGLGVCGVWLGFSD